MEGRFFEPDDKICLIFSNEQYDKLREIPEFSKRAYDHAWSLANEFMYSDMPQAREWADTFEYGIKAYGFSDDQIHRYNDVDRATMSSAFDDFALCKIRQNTEQGRRTLLLCFYAGHGCNDENSTVAYLNSN